MRYLPLVLLGGLASTTFAAHAASTINFRLDVAPDQVAALEAAIAKVPGARIAEPADYRLTTKKDFPQTLMAVDARHPQENVEYVEVDDHARLLARSSELGNFLGDDYPDKLAALVRHALPGKSLSELTQTPGPIEICVKPDSFAPPPDSFDGCRSGAMSAPDADPYDSPSPDDLENFSAVTIRNRGSAPAFVALFLVDSTFAVHRIALNGQQPLVPGASVEGKGPEAGIPAGRYRLVTLWSDRPLDADAGLTGALGPGVAASFAEYRAVTPIIGEMGGGWATSLATAPWMAQIYSTYEYKAADFAEDAKKPPAEREFMSSLNDVQRAHRCGGTLIAPNLVVTAAHCVAKDNFAGPHMKDVMKMRRVRLGTTFLGKGGGTYAIVGLTVPGNYNAKTHENDIALLLLAPDRDTGDVSQRAIKLATVPLVANAPVATFGWGFTEEAAAGTSLRQSLEGEIQRSPDDLQEGALKALPVRLCQQNYGRQLKPGMVCVSGRGNTHVFTCLGDSGGPLVRGTGKRQELVGVTSWANGCGLKNNPDVFTDVTRQAAWIQAARKVLVPGFAEPFPKPQAAASETARH
ncbi:MAG TPA: serine protease [Sphingomicrobium sp.]